MLHPYEVKGEHSINLNRSKLTLKAVEVILRMLQENGEVYVLNAAAEPPQTLVEIWAELAGHSVQKLHLEEGDVLFVNPEAVDIDALMRATCIKVPIVPVYSEHGLTVSDSLAVVRNPKKI